MAPSVLEDIAQASQARGPVRALYLPAAHAKQVGDVIVISPVYPAWHLHATMDIEPVAPIVDEFEGQGAH